MKSKELENPASSPENEQLPVTGVENEETGITTEPIVNDEEVKSEELVVVEEQKPETGVPSEPVVNDEEVKNEELVVIEGPKPQTAGLTEVEVVAAEPSHENESELTDAILEPQLDVVDEEDDPFHDDEPTADGQPIHDYSSYNKINLINTLRKIIGEGDVEVIKPHADAIKACFYKIRNHEIGEQKAVFIAGGN
ncbi:MAG: hypothetical protein AAB347_05110, partial [Bacteroidota bacterium]